MIEQETDCEGHQKLHVIALMTVFKLETDCPSQGLACVVGGFVCERAYEWRGRKGKGKGKRLSNKTASHASYVKGYAVFKIRLKRVLKQRDCVFV